jgi:hypothetical protein
MSNEFISSMNAEQVIAVGTVALVVVTGALVAATVALWRATKKLVSSADESAAKQLVVMQDLVKSSEKHAELRLRAYLHIKSATFKLDEDGNFIAHVVMHNFGQTPALDVAGWIGICATKDLDSEFVDAPPEEVKIGKDIVGPGNFHDWSIPLLTAMPPCARQEIQSNKAAIFVFGCAEYTDVFGYRRKTKYQMYTHGEGFIAHKFSPCRTGNEAN